MEYKTHDTESLYVYTTTYPAKSERKIYKYVFFILIYKFKKQRRKVNKMIEEEINDTLKNHEKRIQILEKIFRSEPNKTKKHLSIKEFILSKKPKDDVQKTLVIGYYLEKYKEMNSFNAKDLEEGFRDAKEKVPTNINDKVIQNIKGGYMTEAKDKKDKLKAYYLTNTGEGFVKNDFRKEE